MYSLFSPFSRLAGSSYACRGGVAAEGCSRTVIFVIAVVQQLCWPAGAKTGDFNCQGIATRQELCRMQGPVRLQSSAAFTPLDYTTVAFSGSIRGIYSALVLEVAFRTARKIVRGCVGVPRIWLTSRCKGLSSPLIVLLCMAWRLCQRRRWLECGLNITRGMRRSSSAAPASGNKLVNVRLNMRKKCRAKSALARLFRTAVRMWS